ncbi:MAG TPA: hypothetical protein VHQ01_08885 [Pyrinomonadaceae bacterium]|nr:hypothetical protein [Pyrinomonadaceae bacterium]
MKFIYAILICFFAGAGVYAQGDQAPTPAVEELYLAKDDGKGKAGEQVSEFSTSDIPIYCVVLLDAGGKVTVKMNFVAVSVTGVKPDTKVVTASYTTKEGQNRVNFSGRPDDKWTPGTYRVDIFIDGKISKNVEFEIKNKSIGATAAKFVPASGPPKPTPPKRKP